MLLLIFLVVIRLPGEKLFLFRNKISCSRSSIFTKPGSQNMYVTDCNMWHSEEAIFWQFFRIMMSSIVILQEYSFFIDQYIPTKGRSYKHKLLILFKRGLFVRKSNKIFLVLTQALSIDYDTSIISDCLDFLLYIPIILSKAYTKSSLIKILFTKYLSSSEVIRNL